MKRAAAILLAGWVGLAGAEDYAYRVELATPGNQPAWRAALPAEVHRGVVRADFADLRVANGAGETVPFALLSGGEKPDTAQPVLPLPLFPVMRNPAAPMGGLNLQVRQGADGTLVSLSSKAPAVAGASAPVYWIADASQVREPLGELRLEWAVTDGVAASLRVEGSDDLKAWRVLADRAPLVDLRVEGRTLRQDHAEIAPTKVRYLRLTIDAQGGPLPIITGLKGVAAAASAETPRRVVKASGRAATAQPLEVEFDLGGRFTVDRVGFALPQVNTLSPAEILVRDRPADPWRPLARTVV